MSYIGRIWNFQPAQDFFVLSNIFLTITCFLLFGLHSVLHGRGRVQLLGMFCFHVLILNANYKNWGRPRNEAIFPAVCFISPCFKFTLAHQVHNIPSLIPRIPHSGMRTLKLCRCGEPGIFSHVSTVKRRKGL